MSIIFSCTCGKRLQAPDEFAGRRMRCKTCGAVIPIPAAKASKAVGAVAVVAKPQAAPEKALPRAEPNPWVDCSLEQRSTPWQAGDDRRPGATEKPPRELGGLILVAVLVLCLGAVAWIVLKSS